MTSSVNFTDDSPLVTKHNTNYHLNGRVLVGRGTRPYGKKDVSLRAERRVPLSYATIGLKILIRTKKKATLAVLEALPFYRN